MQKGLNGNNPVQNPNSKEQIPNKLQIPMTKILSGFGFDFLSLEIV